MGIALSTAAIGLAPGPDRTLEPSRKDGETLQTLLGTHVYSWTVCNAYDADDALYTYTNPLWPDGLKWMQLPPDTHLLLYGRSSIAQVGSALRSAAHVYGVLEKTQVISAARDCADATVHPRRQELNATCVVDCNKYMSLGPSNAPILVDPHSVVVDHLVGGSTITTIANHAQTQRLEARLDDWLKMLAPRNGEANFTHGIFMDPHPQWWFDLRCRDGGANEPHQRLQKSNITQTPEQDGSKWDCQPNADAYCPRRHPLYPQFRKWVHREPAVMILPPRLQNRDIPFYAKAEGGEQLQGVKREESSPQAMKADVWPPQRAGAEVAPPPRTAAAGFDPNPADAPSGGEYLPQDVTADNYKVPHEYELRCVLDEQLKDCPHGRNTTVWLAQTKLIYEYGNAIEGLPPPCYCEHICNARCVRGTSSLLIDQCYVGPGIAATWLGLRAAGLA